MKPKNQSEPRTERMTEENPFLEAGQTLAAMESEGTLPEGFDLEQACGDPKFAELIEAFPVEAAVRIYDAERRAEEAEQTALEQMSSRVSARKALPRSTTANRTTAITPDYRTMSSESFRKLEEQLKQAARNGKKMKL